MQDRTDAPEPRGRDYAHVPNLDAGVATGRFGDGGSWLEQNGGQGSGATASHPPEQDRLHTGRMDGSVQLHLPERPAPPDNVVLSPEELRSRRSGQVALIQERIDALDQRISNATAAPSRSLLEARRAHLIERRDVLIGVLVDPNP